MKKLPLNDRLFIMRDSLNFACKFVASFYSGSADIGDGIHSEKLEEDLDMTFDAFESFLTRKAEAMDAIVEEYQASQSDDDEQESTVDLIKKWNALKSGRVN